MVDKCPVSPTGPQQQHLEAHYKAVQSRKVGVGPGTHLVSCDKSLRILPWSKCWGFCCCCCCFNSKGSFPGMQTNEMLKHIFQSSCNHMFCSSTGRVAWCECFYWSVRSVESRIQGKPWASCKRLSCKFWLPVYFLSTDKPLILIKYYLDHSIFKFWESIFL